MLKTLFLFCALSQTALAQEEAVAELAGVLGAAPEAAAVNDGLVPGADGPTEEDIADMRAFETDLGKRQGTIDISGGLASFETGNDYQYLDSEAAGRVLVAWGNPVDEPPLGMIIPAGLSVFAQDSWAIIVNYEEDGYVSDEDADSIDYNELLDQMKADAAETSEWRVSEGYEAIALTGWAEQPHYDAATHKMYWAKELAFGDSPDHTLNYNIRVLGRRGVLVMNAVAGMHQLGAIKPAMEQVMTATSFKEGNRYVDFDPSMDTMATYGLGALVAGGVATKAGLFKGLFAMLLAGKKVIFGLGAAFIAMAGKFFGGRKDADE